MLCGAGEGGNRQPCLYPHMEFISMKLAFHSF